MRNALVWTLAVAFASSACTQVTVRRTVPPAQASANTKGVAKENERAELDGELLDAMPRLVHSINDARLARGAPVLRIDRGLALVAQGASEEYQRLGRGFERRVAEQASAELRAFSLLFARVAAVVVFVERLDQALAALTPALDPEMRFLGAVVAKSPPPTSARGGYGVVVTLGR